MRLRAGIGIVLLGVSGCAGLPERVRVDLPDGHFEYEKKPVPAPGGAPPRPVADGSPPGAAALPPTR